MYIYTFIYILVSPCVRVYVFDLKFVPRKKEKKRKIKVDELVIVNMKLLKYVSRLLDI